MHGVCVTAFNIYKYLIFKITFRDDIVEAYDADPIMLAYSRSFDPPTSLEISLKCFKRGHITRFSLKREY